MYTTAELMELVAEKVKKEHGTDTAYRIAKVLNVSHGSITRWQTGHPMDDGNALKIAVFLGIDPMTTVAFIHAERNKDEPYGDIWNAIAEATRQFVMSKRDRHHPKKAA